MQLTQRFSEALAFADRRHRRHVRKGTETPYISHLLAVAAIVLEFKGTEDESIAALLHDAVEDKKATAEEIHDTHLTAIRPHLRQEPDAAMLHVRICAGGAG